MTTTECFRRKSRSAHSTWNRMAKSSRKLLKPRTVVDFNENHPSVLLWYRTDINSQIMCTLWHIFSGAIKVSIVCSFFVIIWRINDRTFAVLLHATEEVIAVYFIHIFTSSSLIIQGMIKKHIHYARIYQVHYFTSFDNFLCKMFFFISRKKPLCYMT